MHSSKVTGFVLVLTAFIANPAQLFGDTTITVTRVGNDLMVSSSVVNEKLLNQGQPIVVTFDNQTGGDINVDNTVFPAGGTDKDGDGTDIPDTMTADYTFNCGIDAGSWELDISQAGATNALVTVNISCNDPPIPSASQWGLIILASLMAVGAILALRGRKVKMA